MSDGIGLHDAEIITIEVDRLNHVAGLGFRRENGEYLHITFSGVIAFRAEDVTMQNVVSDGLSSCDGNLSLDDQTYWLNWASSLSDAKPWASASTIDRWRHDISSKKLVLFVFIPSAGAQIAVLCEEVKVER
tara:strand:+ start:404 stop:799 length:396 start_codon:yes stop_codon:yes gene_type:complete